MFKAENYITIQGWMRTELDLKGNDLMVYAIIYGFSQIENQMYTGNRQYLADWCGATKQGISKNLKHLEQMGLIDKHEQTINGVKFVAYYAKPLREVGNVVDICETELPGGQQSLPGWATEFTGGGQLSCPNNIIYTPKDNITPYRPPEGETDGLVGFDEFWAVYPNKVAPSRAKQKWAKLKPSKELLKVMLKDIERKKETIWKDKDKQYIPHPTTYLNQRRWEDETDSEEQQPQKTPWWQLPLEERQRLMEASENMGNGTM